MSCHSCRRGRPRLTWKVVRETGGGSNEEWERWGGCWGSVVAVVCQHTPTPLGSRYVVVPPHMSEWWIQANQHIEETTAKTATSVKLAAV